MKVLIDTPIWSYALRSDNEEFVAYVNEFQNLLKNQRVIIIGPIRQELLSGYSDIKKFEKLNEKLSYFDNSPILDIDYVEAAKFSNICRANGIIGSHIDYLICAVAVRIEVEIFTTDKYFNNYARYLPLDLYKF